MRLCLAWKPALSSSRDNRGDCSFATLGAEGDGRYSTYREEACSENVTKLAPRLQQKSGCFYGLSGLFAMVITLSGCSWLGLDEGLERRTCASEPANFCESLNELSPSEDNCQRWGCNQTTGYCDLMTRDDDKDGTPGEACIAQGLPFDCDDTDATRGLSVREICDGKDNNCNNQIDEGLFGARTPERVFEVAGVDNRALSVRFQGDMASSTIGGGLTYTALTTAQVAGTGTANYQLPYAVLLDPQLRIKEQRAPRYDLYSAISNMKTNSVESDPVNEFVWSAAKENAPVIAVVRAKTNEAFATWSGLESDAVRVDAEVSHFTNGFDAGANAASRIAVGNRGNDILAAYVDRAANANDSCENTPVAKMRVTSLFGQVASDTQRTFALGRQQSRVYEDGVPINGELGLTRDPSPPALLNTKKGWLLAFAHYNDVTGRSEVHIRSVTISFTQPFTDSTGFVHVSRPLFIEKSNSASELLGDVTLVAGTETNEVLTVGLAYRRGCAENSRAFVRLLRYSLNSDKIEPVMGAMQAPLSGPQTQPSLAFNADVSLGWLFAWIQNHNSIRTLRVSANGAVIDNAPIPAFGNLNSTLPSGVYIHAEPAGYRLLTHVRGPARDAFWRTQMTCVSPK